MINSFSSPSKYPQQEFLIHAKQVPSEHFPKLTWDEFAQIVHIDARVLETSGWLRIRRISSVCLET